MTKRGALVWVAIIAATNLATYKITKDHMVNKVLPSMVANEKFKSERTEPTVCRVYINQDGMMDVSSPDGTVEIYTTDNNLVVGEDDDDGG